MVDFRLAAPFGKLVAANGAKVFRKTPSGRASGLEAQPVAITSKSYTAECRCLRKMRVQ